MKKLILATMMLCASTAQAADWSPVFKTWSKGCYVYQNKIEEAVINAASSMNHNTTEEGDFLMISHQGLNGDYSSVPLPYRNDMLPAYTTTKDYEVGSIRKIVIPLQNATYAKMPLKSYSFESNDLYWAYELNVGKYTKAKELKLKRIQRSLYNGYQSVEVTRTQDDELTLSCHVVTSG